MANFTDNENQKAYEKLFCSEKLTGTTHNQLICLIVVNIFLSITAFLGNTLILIALHKESFLHPPSKLLFRCLATTDLCVGIIAEPLVVTYWMSVVTQRWNICRYAQASIFVAGHVLCSVSLLTLTAISVDRLLALLLGLRYRQLVTLKRTYASITVLWIVSIVGSAMYFRNYLTTLEFGYIGALLLIVISIFCYAKIFLTLRRHQNRVHDQVQQEEQNRKIPLNISRYRKAVSSALWLQLTLAVCYLPYGIVATLMTQRGLSPPLYLARQAALTLILLNSSLNPILYCWKMRDVRKQVKDTVRKFFCSSN